MSEVITTFNDKRRAQIFVELLKTKGAIEAGNYILKEVPEGERDSLQREVNKILPKPSESLSS